MNTNGRVTQTGRLLGAGLAFDEVDLKISTASCRDCVLRMNLEIRRGRTDCFDDGARSPYQQMNARFRVLVRGDDASVDNDRALTRPR
jgi:hypothetical protein